MNVKQSAPTLTRPRPSPIVWLLNRLEQVQVGSMFRLLFKAMTGKRPTITDVAKQTGVSKATVSAVLNDSAAVKTDTRDRVLVAIEHSACTSAEAVAVASAPISLADAAVPPKIPQIAVG